MRVRIDTPDVWDGEFPGSGGPTEPSPSLWAVGWPCFQGAGPRARLIASIVGQPRRKYVSFLAGVETRCEDVI
jgi:hypothetical protein